MKTCSKCGKSLPASSFHKNRSTRDGLQRQCKECMNWRKQRARTERGVIDAVLPTVEALAKNDLYWLNRLHTLQAKAEGRDGAA